MYIVLNEKLQFVLFFRFHREINVQNMREMIEFCLRTERIYLREGKKAVARRLSTRKCRLEDRPKSRCTSLEHDYLPVNSRGS